MIRLKVLELLKEKNHTKYWLFIRMGLSYRNFDRLIKNDTSAIRFENLEKLCRILECTPNDLFVIEDDPDDEELS